MEASEMLPDRITRFTGYVSLFVIGLWVGAVTAAAEAPKDRERPTDRELADQVEDELIRDPAVPGAQIDVKADQGIVTLEGRVNNVLAQERAAYIAEVVRGVRAVINRIEVRPSDSRSDAEVLADVKAALLADPALESYEIDATVEDCVVTLTGSVQSLRERDLVKRVVKGVRGVVAIEDAVQVNYDTERPDSELEEEIKRALHWNIFVDDGLIDVAVRNSEVKLTGVVGSAVEKVKATAIAWVAGVKSVDASGLEVEPWARDEAMRRDKYLYKSDEVLRDVIEEALLRDPRVASYQVNVDVDAGYVTLRGVVGDARAKRAAEQDARHTVGVNFVNNRLKVRIENPSSDADLYQKVQDAIERDPYLSRFEITAVVMDGQVRLYGEVDTRFERQRAEEVVERVSGITRAINYLRVADWESGADFYDPYVDDSYLDPPAVTEYKPRAPNLSDQQIELNIKDEMWWSPFVGAKDITVSVENGVATLSGTVESWAERQSATENAYEGGATLVDNNTVIRSD
jgi:osmotically-inducible protein OsmY